MAIAQNKLVEKAQKEYEYLTGDAATRRLEELREKAIYDEYFAYERGEEKGERRGKIKIAIEMVKNNISMDIIAKCTGLSKKELDKLVLEKQSNI